MVVEQNGKWKVGNMTGRGWGEGSSRIVLCKKLKKKLENLIFLIFLIFLHLSTYFSNFGTKGNWNLENFTVYNFKAFIKLL